MKSIICVSKPYDLPYESTPSDGTHRHIDLRVRPDEINSIPELRGEADLKELVAVLNRPHGSFMTHGCAKAKRPPYEPGGEFPLSEESRSATHWRTSYVTFSFWQLSENKPEKYVPIYEQFKTEANGTEVCFVIQAAYFLTSFEISYGNKWSDSNATVCLVWVTGWGDSDAVAHSRWRNVTRQLTAFFDDRKAFPDYDCASGLTVSQHMRIIQR